MNGIERDDRDRLFEMAVARLLGFGVVTSSMCLAAGLALSLAGPGGGAAARLLLGTGIVLLVATPVARVAVSAGTYFFRRDWLFAVLTLVVFLELVASVVAAFHRG